MQDFDNKAVGLSADMRAKLKTSTMVKESKSRQRNAWGTANTVSARGAGIAFRLVFRRRRRSETLNVFRRLSLLWHTFAVFVL